MPKIPRPIWDEATANSLPPRLRTRARPKRNLRGSAATAQDAPQKPTLSLLPAEKLLKPGAVLKVLHGIKRRIAQLKSDYERELYKEFAKLRDLARFLENDSDSWAEFCRDGYWQKRKYARDRPKLHAPEEASRFLVQHLCADISKRKSRNRRVNVYFSALRELDARKVSVANTVQAMFEARGVRGLSRAWARRQEAERVAAGLVIAPKAKRNPNGDTVSGNDQGSLSDRDTPSMPKDKKRHQKPNDATNSTPNPGVPKTAPFAVLIAPSKAARRLLNGGPGAQGRFTVTVTKELRGEPVLRLRKLE